MMMVVVVLLMNGPFESNLTPYDSLPLNALAGNSQEQRHCSNNNNSAIEFRKLIIDIHYFLKIILFLFGLAGSLLLVGLFSACREGGLLSGCRVQFLIAVASPVAEHGL